MKKTLARTLEWLSFALGLVIVGSCVASGGFEVAPFALILAAVVVAVVFAITRRPPWLGRAVEWGSLALGLLVIGPCTVIGLEGSKAALLVVPLTALLVGLVFFFTRRPPWLGKALEWGSLGIGLLLMGSCAMAGLEELGALLMLPFAVVLVALVFYLTRRPPWLGRALEWSAAGLGLLILGSCVFASGKIESVGPVALGVGGVAAAALLVAVVFAFTRWKALDPGARRGREDASS